MLHTLAFCREAGIDYPLSRINGVADKIPHSQNRSLGAAHIEDLHRAGGIPALLKEISRKGDHLLHLDSATVSGKTLRTIVNNASADHEVIRAGENSHSATGGTGKSFRQPRS